MEKDSGIKNWFALYVKSRHEAVTQTELEHRGINTFVPMVNKLRFWKDRKKYIDFPLFPSYVFVQIHANPEEYLRVLRTRGAVRLVGFEEGRPSSIPCEEIESLRILLTSGEDLDVFPHLKEGERVGIKEGPLKGAEGILVRKESRCEFVVNVGLLGRCVAVKVLGEYLDAA